MVAKKKIKPEAVSAKPIQTEPSMLEQAMALLIQSTAKNTQILEKVAGSLDTMNDRLNNPMVVKDHQIDLELENKQRPFKLQMKYYVEMRTQDLGDGIWDYEDPIGRAYNSRAEAQEFGMKQYGQNMFRILEVEAPMSN